MTWKNGEYLPKQKRSDEKKCRILDAALELFATQGFHGTTAKAIAARAEVATGSFYRYFRDKKAAFMAVARRLEREFGGRVFEHGEQMRQQGHSEREVLVSLTRFAVEGHHRHKGFHREMLAMEILDHDIAAWSRKREQRLLDSLTTFLQAKRAHYRVQDLEAAAEMVLYSIEEIAHRSVLFEDPLGEKRLVRALQEMLLRYLFD
jgi:AcrR family transcriptional regulator